MLAATACGARPGPVETPSSGDRVAIIASERGPQGARLVAIDEHGDRQFALIVPARGTVRDTNPAGSPDGRWVVFASSRERPIGETSLWIAPVAEEAVPVRLTTGPSIESHPTWTPDGTAIVFASTRQGPDFDLWRIPVLDGRAHGEAVALTTSDGFEVTPTVAADGTIIYAAVTPREGGDIESRLEELRPDGSIHALTAGPGDTTPALSPDGATLAFARPVVHATGASAELWLMPRAGGEARAITVLPPTEESGPVWSRDGRFVFATSLLRGDEGVLFSSVIHVEVAARAPVVRILRDQAGAIARLTPAIVAPVLDDAALRADPAYLPELARIMNAAVEEQRSEEAR